MTREELLAIAKAEQIRASRRAKAASTGVVEQGLSGLNEGIAGFAGMPVDAVAGGLNAAYDALAPQGYEGEVTPDGQLRLTEPEPRAPLIENPVGGSEWFGELMAPTISDTPPQTMPQRFARRVGQEAGYGVPSALAAAAFPPMAAARGNMPAYLAGSAAGDVGAGLAGQGAAEFTDNPLLQIVAAMGGGAAGAGAVSRMVPQNAPRPSLEEQSAKAREYWEKVKAAPETLTDAATDRLRAELSDTLPKSQMAQNAYPNAFGAAADMDVLKNPTVYDVVEARRIIGDRVAADPKEAKIGVDMKRSIQDYLESIEPADLNGGTADDTIDALRTANDTTARVKRAEAVINKDMRGESRAATTGTGGNEVNAKRQNIRTLLDVERDPTLSGKRKGFTPDEMELMERVVYGSKGENMARLAGRLAPTSGALGYLGSLAGASGATAALTSGNPFLALGMIPPGVGAIAKNYAERSTEKNIKELIATILGGKAKPSSAKSAAQAAIIEQLMSSAAAGNQQ
jgi:hypothetical protein